MLGSGWIDMLPEEKELARLEAEQSELKEQVISAELELETTKTETAKFQHRYYKAVGRLYARLDSLHAQIANLRTEQAPDDHALRADATAAKRRAEKSAEEAGLAEKQPRPSTVISPDLKQAYRQAVKLIHPDLATRDHERKRRTELMALINLAYERGDQRAIEKIVENFGQDPEAIVGEDIASRLVKAIRRCGQLRRRLAEVRYELDTHKKSELFQLKHVIETAEAIGGDPLGDLAKQLMREISECEIRLNTMHRSTH